MFTGIVQEVGKVTSVTPGRLAITAGHVLKGMEPGGSMAVNGVCLTITRLDAGSFSVDVVPETLSRTNLGLLKAGDGVNLEPPLALGGQLGGHLVQGHIDGYRLNSLQRECHSLDIPCAPRVNPTGDRGLYRLVTE